MPCIKVSEGGRSNGVSYVLLHKEKNMLSEDFQILWPTLTMLTQNTLILTGEIQSTGDPDTQNSIYGMESLLKCDEDDNRPIVCITLFKRKYATLSVARPVRMEGQSEDVVGKVSLTPIDLIHNLQIFAKKIILPTKIQC